MQRLTCTLTLYMNVCNFLRSRPSLVCRDCDMVCVCVCIIVPLGTASQHFSMLGIPLRGPIIPMGKSKILKKKPEKKLAYACSKITDVYGNIQCFVLPRPFSGGENRVARLYVHTEYKSYS